MKDTRKRLAVCSLSALVSLAGWGAEAPTRESATEAGEESAQRAPPARWSVRGHGLMGNLRLKQQLRVLAPDSGLPERFDASTLEDASLLLLSALQREGYLRPALELTVGLDDGSEHHFRARPEEPLELPSEWRAKRATFQVERGLFHYYSPLRFKGLSALTETRAATYFLVPDLVVPLKKPKVYTPERLTRSLANFRDELRRFGYREAEVEAAAVNVNPETGQTAVTVEVRENRRWWVTKLETRTRDRSDAPTAPVAQRSLREPFSPAWEQELARTLRNAELTRGFPDATVTLESEVVAEREAEVDVRVVAHVVRGPRIRVGEMTISGLQRSRESLVRPRARLTPGDPLDRLAVDEARLQLLRLGVFDRVDAEIVPGEDEETRDVHWTLREAKPLEFSVLAGYGSYEMLWGGLELEQLNLFGLAHRHRLLAAQSFKSTKLEYAYTIPEVFNPLGEVTALGSFRRRQETTFTREDYGASLGYQRLLPRWRSTASVRLGYEQLTTDDPDFNPDYGLQRASATSLGFALDHNRTDNVLDPLRGYRLYATTELATDLLGGEASFGRFELGVSKHWPLRRTLILHAGLSHAAVLTPGPVADDLPFNKRFFLGGASSVRGYVQGEAASRDPAGKLVGDESYLLGQFELEQRLTGRWSVMGFADVAGLARDLADYPAGEWLASLGAGVRWRTPVGPVRLEYGYNLNRRAGDPTGALQFSVGFPF